MRFRMKATVAAGALGLLAWTTCARAAEKATMLGRAAASKTVRFSVYVPLQHRDELETMLTGLHDPSSAMYHKWLKPAEFKARFGPSAESLKAVQQQLGAYGLVATQTSAHRLEVTGVAGAVERAFGTELKVGHFANGREAVAATTALTKPTALVQTNAVVAGLSGRIRMQVHSRRAAFAVPENRYSTAGPYWFDDLKQAYGYPSYQAYDGTGTTIAILMTGDYQASDMAKYFGHEKLPVPSITEVKVNGGAPYDPNGASGETHLDIQQSGGMAPKANILFYNIPDLSDDSFMAGLTQILEDNKADVVNMSFGGAELLYTAAFNDGVDSTDLLREEDDLMAQGNAQGITFVASSGDSGALTVPPLACFAKDATSSCGQMLASANAPASGLHVTGVGGTNLVTTYTGATPFNLNSAYVSEEAYADPLPDDIFYGTPATGVFWGSGGGDSMVFRKPAYQYLVKTGNARFRTVPDVSLHMGGCPEMPAAGSCNPADSGDIEALDGKFYVVIGTSASAPDFAGLTALAVQRFGTRLGNENYYLYALAAAQAAGLPVNVFRQGIPGFNGLYSSGNQGYNRVLGNGTVRGTEFLLAPLAPVAGVPQTASNP